MDTVIERQRLYYYKRQRMNNEDICKQVTDTQTLAIQELSRAHNAVKQSMMHLADLGIESEMLQGITEYIDQQITVVQRMRLEAYLW